MELRELAIPLGVVFLASLIFFSLYLRFVYLKERRKLEQSQNVSENGQNKDVFEKADISDDSIFRPD